MFPISPPTAETNFWIDADSRPHLLGRQILAMILLSCQRLDSAIISVFTGLIPHICPFMDILADMLELAKSLLDLLFMGRVITVKFFTSII